MLAACNKSENLTKLDGKVNSISDCKLQKSLRQTESDSLSYSCVQYSFSSSNNVLKLKHLNAVFNCCPKKINCDFNLKNDTIFITESETDGNCDCMCLYDIETEISGLKPDQYVIKFQEPYLGDQQVIVFLVDLTQQLSGEYCVERTNYPYPGE